MTQPTLDPTFDTASDGHGYGLLGVRRLVAVQMIDIGRLTSEVVPLPRGGGLVVLTGRGPAKKPDRPAGSNGASKTTFSAAVDLLMLSHAWRPRSPRVGNHAAGLVFRIAGDPSATADVGYIIGAFRSDAHPDPVTVMCRIRRHGDDKLRYRVVPGVAFAAGASHAERIADAGRLWEEQTGPVYSARQYLDQVLGGHPRSAGYVNERGDLISPAVSIFTTELTKVPRGQIAADLIELAGLGDAVRGERERRAEVAANRGEVAAASAQHATTEADVAGRLAVFDARERALTFVEQAADDRTAWMVARTGELTARLAELAAERSALEGSGRAVALRSDIAQAEADVVRLSDRRLLERRLAAAEARLAEIEPEWQALIDAVADADATVRAVTARIAEDGLRETAATDTGRDLASVTADRAAAAERLAEGRGDVGYVRAERDRAAGHLAQLRDAGSAAARAVADAGVAVAVLADVVTPTADGQATLDALLSPWAEALVVAPEDRDAAVAAAAERPGTIIIAGVDAPLPDGVADAPEAVRSFLAALAGGATVDGDVVTVTAPPHTVVGGFDLPRTGRAARIAAAEAQLDAAEDLVTEASDTVERVAAEVADLDVELAAVTAAAKLRRLTAELQQANTDLAGAVAARDDRAEEHGTAAAAVTTARTESDRQGELADDARAGLEDKRAIYKAEVADPAARLRAAAEQIAIGPRLAHLAEHVPAVAGVIDRFDPYRPDPDDVAAVVDATTGYVTAFLSEEGPGDVAVESLRKRASRRVRDALTVVGITTATDTGRPSFPVEVPHTVRTAVNAYLGVDDSVDEASPASSATRALHDLVAAVSDWLGPLVERDGHERARQQQRLAESAAAVAAAEESFERQQAAVNAIQASVIERVEMTLDQVDVAFRARVAAVDGQQARLRYTRVDPDSPQRELVWEATPAWAREDGGDAIAYDAADPNTGHVKVRAFQLVLAALQAGVPGRVLLLDELTAGLDTVHISEVLDALATTARREGLTVIVALQDTAARDGVVHADEMLYFHRPLETDRLNVPTTVLLAGPDDELRQIAADVAASRGLGWTPLVLDEAAWDGTSTLVPDDLSGLDAAT